MTRRALTLLAMALAAACGDAEPVDPVAAGAATSTGGGSPTTTDTGSGGHGGDAGPPKRTVETRNPFGNVAKSGNLLWDGDFEWSSPFSDQYGWINYPQPTSGFGFEGIVIGSACRSGIKCASVDKGRSIIGIAVSSVDAKLATSFWAKLAKGTCADVEGRLVSLATNDPGVPITAESDAPGDDGWCHYETTVEPQPLKVYLWIHNKTGDVLVVDDAVVERVPPTKALTAPVDAPPTAALAEEIAAVQAEVRRRAMPVDPPPTAARRALEAWASKKHTGGAR